MPLLKIKESLERTTLSHSSLNSLKRSELTWNGTGTSGRATGLNLSGMSLGSPVQRLSVGRHVDSTPVFDNRARSVRFSDGSAPRALERIPNGGYGHLRCDAQYVYLGPSSIQPRVAGEQLGRLPYRQVITDGNSGRNHRVPGHYVAAWP